MQKQLFDMCYPIGRGFIDFTDTDYSNYLGFSWERELLGRFPIGANDTTYTIGKTGGSNTKTISKNNLPNYNLTVNDPGHAHIYNDDVNTGGGNGSDIFKTEVASSNIAAFPKYTEANTTGITVNSGGKGAALDVTPAYKAVYYWKRVS